MKLFKIHYKNTLTEKWYHSDDIDTYINYNGEVLNQRTHIDRYRVSEMEGLEDTEVKVGLAAGMSDRDDRPLFYCDVVQLYFKDMVYDEPLLIESLDDLCSLRNKSKWDNMSFEIVGGLSSYVPSPISEKKKKYEKLIEKYDGCYDDIEFRQLYGNNIYVFDAKYNNNTSHVLKIEESNEGVSIYYAEDGYYERYDYEDCDFELDKDFTKNEVEELIK